MSADLSSSKRTADIFILLISVLGLWTKPLGLCQQSLHLDSALLCKSNTMPSFSLCFCFNPLRPADWFSVSWFFSFQPLHAPSTFFSRSLLICLAASLLVSVLISRSHFVYLTHTLFARCSCFGYHGELYSAEQEVADTLTHREPKHYTVFTLTYKTHELVVQGNIAKIYITISFQEIRKDVRSWCYRKIISICSFVTKVLHKTYSFKKRK